jgi:hypothetical protein
MGCAALWAITLKNHLVTLVCLHLLLDYFYVFDLQTANTQHTFDPLSSE